MKTIELKVASENFCRRTFCNKPVKEEDALCPECAVVEAEDARDYAADRAIDEHKERP